MSGTTTHSNNSGNALNENEREPEIARNAEPSCKFSTCGHGGDGETPVNTGCSQDCRV